MVEDRIRETPTGMRAARDAMRAHIYARPLSSDVQCKTAVSDLNPPARDPEYKLIQEPGDGYCDAGLVHHPDRSRM